MGAGGSREDGGVVVWLVGELGVSGEEGLWVGGDGS